MYFSAHTRGPDSSSLGSIHISSSNHYSMNWIEFRLLDPSRISVVLRFDMDHERR